jgi:hypothetical protein
MFEAFVASVVAEAAKLTPFVLVQVSARLPAELVQSPVCAGSWAACNVPLTPVERGLVGISPATKEHGPKDVADPQVPMTWCAVWPVAAPSVRVGPEIVQVNQLAPVAEQEVAPDEGGGKAPSVADAIYSGCAQTVCR